MIRRGARAHETVHRSPRRLFPAVAVPAVADDLPVRARDRRSGEPAGGARRQPGGHRRRCAASSVSIGRCGCSTGSFMASLVHRRSRPVLLLSHAGAGALFPAAAELAAAGGRGDGPVAADRHPERHPGRRARRRLLGQRRQDLRAARPVAAVLLGRPGADPVLLRLSRLAAVLGLRHGVAPAHAGLRARLVLRRRAHAAHALLDARRAGLGIRQAGAAQGPARGAGHRQARASRTR